MALPTALIDALRDFTEHRQILVGSDFDGVLAPLVDDPETSRPLPGSIELLESLAARPGVDTAIVSGRDLRTLRRLAGVAADSPIALIGSHGGESSVPLPHARELDERAQERLKQATLAMKSVALAFPGTRVEHKQAGVVLHTRDVPPEIGAPAAEAAARIPEQVPGTHLMTGKDVVEIAVFDVSKGVALHSLRDVCHAQVVLYLGDDKTDELAFEALADEPANVAIKVGAGDTVARHRIPSPDDVLDVLAEVGRLRC